MIQILFKDGALAVVGRDDIKVVLPPLEEGGEERVYALTDMHLTMVEPVIFVGQGLFQPPGSKEGMPIRSLRLMDPSDFAVEVPMPIAEAEELSKRLASPKVEIASRIPSGLVLPR